MFWFWDAHWVRRAFAHANGNVYANHPWQQLRHQVLPSSVLAKWPYGMRDRAESKNFVTCIARASAARQRAMTVFVFRPATRHGAVWSTEYWGDHRQRAAAVCSRSEGVLYCWYGLRLVVCGVCVSCAVGTTPFPSSRSKYTSPGLKMDAVDIDHNFEPQIRARSNTWPLRPNRELEQGSGSPASEDPNAVDVQVKAEKDPLGLTAKKSGSRRNAWGNLSYADLITKAIQSSPEKRLTLSQIYDWMVQNVPYFKDKGDSTSSAGWKVSSGDLHRVINV